MDAGAEQKRVFITGSTGTMGLETLKQFLKRPDRFKLRLLVRDTRKDRQIIAPYRNNENIEIVYGDLKDAHTIEQCVRGADYVLHIGALVSPLADRYPEETLRVNYGSTVSIIDAIKKQDNADDIALVYIGTIAETGCRLFPVPGAPHSVSSASQAAYPQREKTPRTDENNEPAARWDALDA